MAAGALIGGETGKVGKARGEGKGKPDRERED